MMEPKGWGEKSSLSSDAFVEDVVGDEAGGCVHVGGIDFGGTGQIGGGSGDFGQSMGRSGAEFAFFDGFVVSSQSRLGELAVCLNRRPRNARVVGDVGSFECLLCICLRGQHARPQTQRNAAL